MKAGKADRQIVIERATVTTNTMGDEIPTWGTICTLWAEINYGRGDERRQAAQENSTLAATFRVRANQTTLGVTTKDRIQFNGPWDVTSVAPYNRDAVDITATRAA